jgi:hypothetical protein
MTGKAGLAVTESIIRQIGMPAASAQEASPTGAGGRRAFPSMLVTCIGRGMRLARLTKGSKPFN